MKREKYYELADFIVENNLKNDVIKEIKNYLKLL